MKPDIVALGEPLLELNAVEGGLLRSVRRYEVGWGGDTSNFAVAVARLGGSVGYISRIGDDEFGKSFLQLWDQEGVDTRHVIVEENAYTGIYFVSRVSDLSRFTYYRESSASSRISPSDVPETYIKEAKLLHTSGISQAISPSACDAVFDAIEVARQSGTLVCYDPNVRLQLWGQSRARAVVLETIGLADFVLPSLEDAAAILNIEDPARIVEKLLASGPRAVVLKLGENGVLVGFGDDIEHVQGLQVDVVDTTGAGDTFAAAFTLSYLEGNEFTQCARFANAAAALASRGKGAVTPIPDRESVEQFIQAVEQP